jgi:hypothetical protein
MTQALYFHSKLIPRSGQCLHLKTFPGLAGPHNDPGSNPMSILLLLLHNLFYYCDVPGHSFLLCCTGT